MSLTGDQQQPPCPDNTACTYCTQALIIGAGPVGLFAAFQLGLLGIEAHIIEALPYAGGQCRVLYPQKLIYDVPGLPACSGQELIDRLLQQLRPFGTVFHFKQQLLHINARPEGGFVTQTQEGLRINSRVIFVATGAGAFLPRPLSVPGMPRLMGPHVIEGPFLPAMLTLTAIPSSIPPVPATLPIWQPTPATVLSTIAVVGYDDSAAASALLAIQCGYWVHFIQPKHEADISPEHQTKLLEACAQGRMQWHRGRVVSWQAMPHHQTHLQISLTQGGECSIQAQWVNVCLGLVPQPRAILQWGLQLERKLVVVNPATFASSTPGIFAIGDACHYPDKKTLIVCGFHEATMAAHQAQALCLSNYIPQAVQYTTSSRELQQRLKVL